MTKHHPRFVLGLFGLVGLTATAIGCGGGDESSSTSSTPSTPVRATQDITLRSDVKQLDGTSWDALLVAHEGPGLWMKPEAKDKDVLRPGTVTVVKGRGVLKVASVREEGDHVVVEQAPVGFGEFIENGSMSLAGKIRFDQPFTDEPHEREIRDMGKSAVDPAAPPAQDADAGTPAPAPDPAPAPEAAPPPPDPQPEGSFQSFGLHPLGDDPLKEESSLGKPGKQLFDDAKSLLTDGWQMSKTVSGDGDALHYDIVLTKSSGGIMARLEVKGSVNNLATAFEVGVKNRVTDRQVMDVKTSGEADLTWDVGITEGSVGYNKLLLPGVAYRQPFMVGEVPMVLKVKSGFALVIGATGRNTMTSGKAHVTWSNDGGVKVTGGAGDADASGSADLSLAKHNGTVAVGPSAFGVVATLPRVEVGVGVDKLFVTGGYFSNTANTLVKSVGGLGGNPCALVETKLDGKTGLYLDAGLGGSLALKALDLAEDKLSKKLYEVEKSGTSCP